MVSRKNCQLLTMGLPLLPVIVFEEMVDIEIFYKKMRFCFSPTRIHVFIGEKKQFALEGDIIISTVKIMVWHWYGKKKVKKN